ncbi:MAG: ATP-binding protein, partial [bacterium]
AIVIDPKGDLSNLLLTFPQLRGEDFLPWINIDDARQKGLSPQDYAVQQAELWDKGLANWGQSNERIQRLRDAAEFTIYTPGSSAGIPISILKSFAAPESEIIQDTDLMRDRINTTVTSLLGLLGIEADPIQSREHILLSTLIDASWRKGQDLDLATLIQQVQTPPVTKIGVLDLESFYPAKDRFGLVMALNNLLASPGFNAWLEGEALNVGQILYTPEGKPRIAVFSISHLSDSERMFFVSLLLNQILGWMRTQSGTTSLRAIVYMDEIFGYLPPIGNPPSKMPLLTLLKQARAFGLGIALATQNPVDLDYKALSNAGTWFIGRLQTERDKSRLLEGLEGAAASTGTKFDRQGMEQILAGLGNRVFLMNNVHEDAPEVFQTRWVLSYLRGPLTRDQIKTLMEQKKISTPTATPTRPASFAATATTAITDQPPALSPDIANYFIPIRGSAPEGMSLVYEPRILGAAKLRFSDTKAKVDVTKDVTFLTPITDDPIPVKWEDAQHAEITISDMEKSPQASAKYGQLLAIANQAKSYADWNKDFSTWLYGSQKLELLKSPSLNEISNPNEAERDFRIRLQQVAREHRDEAVERLRQKYAPKITTLQDRIRRAQQAVEREAAQAKQAQLQSAFSIGATLLGAFMGRKISSHSAISRATTAARGVGRSMQQRGDVARAQENVEALQQQLADLEAQFSEETTALESKIDPQTESFETIVIKPKKTDISIKLVTLVWEPQWQDAQGNSTTAW